jgi:two-component system, NarL family, response regulator YdfI
VIRVLIGARSEVARAGLASLLTADPRFQVVGTFSIDDALTRVEDLQPEIVLLDLDSPSDESLSAAIQSGGALVNSSVMILTEDPESLAVDVLGSGLRAILPRYATPEEIIAAIQAAATGLVALHPEVFDSMLSRIRPGQQSELDPSGQILTPREIEVLRMIAEGLGNKEIASKLSISDHTVKFHISSIFAKLGASNRAEAVTLGIRHGLIMV